MFIMSATKKLRLTDPEDLASSTDNWSYREESEMDFRDGVSFGSNCQYWYKTTDYIGRGAFGTVYKATITGKGEFTGKGFAAVKITHVSDDLFDNAAKWNKLRERWATLLQLKHQHIVVYHKITFARTFVGASVEYLMDYYDNSLASDLSRAYKIRSKLPKTLKVLKLYGNSLLSCYTAQIASGLQFLHEQNIIHGDLKPENVLVRHREEHHDTLYIADLDDLILRQPTTEPDQNIARFQGTLRYVSPEMLRKSVLCTFDGVVGPETDVWSVGCIIAEFASCNDLPFDENENRILNFAQFIDMVIDGHLPLVSANVSEPLATLIRRCLAVTSADRITAADLVKELTGMAADSRQAEPAAELEQRFLPRLQKWHKCICPYCPEILGSTSSSRESEAKSGAKSESFGSKCTYVYDDEDILGKWKFGAIYKGNVAERNDFNGGELVAVKVFRLDRNSAILQNEKMWAEIKERWKSLISQAERSVSIATKHLLQYHKVTLCDVAGGISVEILMDYCDGGSLASYLRNEVMERPNQMQTICYAMQIADALSYLHRRQFIHGILKPSTVLIKRTKKAHTLLQVGGLDDLVQKQDSISYSTSAPRLQNTIRYMSPEMLSKTLRSESEPQKVISDKTDMWSLGCIMLDLANFSMGQSEVWLLSQDTGDRISVPEDVLDMSFAMNIVNGYAPEIVASIPDMVAVCIRICLCRESENRALPEDLLQKLQEAGTVLLAHDEKCNAEEVEGCICADILSASRKRQERSDSSYYTVEDVINRTVTLGAADTSLKNLGLSKLVNKLELIKRILQRLNEIHSDEKGGCDFRPNKVRLGVDKVVLPPRDWTEIDEKFIKHRHEEAVRALVYTAPEVLRGIDSRDVKLLQMSDIWSFGCLCLYIISGDDPKYYRMKLNGERCLLNKYKNGFVAITLAVGDGICIPEYEGNCSNNSALNEMLQKCFQFKAEQRPSATQLNDELLPACKDHARKLTFVTTLGQDLVSFEFTQVLQHGPRGDVYLARSTDLAKRGVSADMAAEVMVLPADPTERSQLITEYDARFEVFKDLKHENIIRYIQHRLESLVVNTMHLAATDCYCMFLEYCTGGTLHDAAKISSNRQHIQEWTRQICTGLQYLHDNRVVHRDIKGSNILLSCRDYDKCTMKITGISSAARQLRSSVTERDEVSGLKGTTVFMSPEMLQGWNYDSPHYSVGRKTDIWSLGCVLIEMYTGDIPRFFKRGFDDPPVIREGISVAFLVGNGGFPEIPSDIPKDAYDWIQRCLHRVPVDRPTAAELLGHPFLTNESIPVKAFL